MQTSEVAGVIDVVGDGVSHLKKGDKVVSLHWVRKSVKDFFPFLIFFLLRVLVDTAILAMMDTQRTAIVAMSHFLH
jgi:NADPH:quinone reductase-like Zn-dependent oxidoreductase